MSRSDTLDTFDTTGPLDTVSRRDWTRPAAGVFVAVFILRSLGAGWRGGFAPFFPDSFSFLEVAGIGPLWPSFWFGDRPVGLPLVAWLLGRNVRAIVLFQTLAYALAAAALCAHMIRHFAVRAWAWLVSAAVISVAVRPRHAQWNLEVLSESLGLTTSMLTLLAWMSYARRPERRTLGWAVAASAALLATRDAHAATVVLVVLGLGLGAWRARRPDMGRPLLIGAAVLTLGLIHTSVSQSISERNQYPLMNNVGLRILPDQEMTSRWVERGMPMSPALLERTGRNTWDDGEAFLRAPELDEFRDWVRGSGQTDQTLSLLVDADFWVERFRADLPTLAAYDYRDYDRSNIAERLPDRLFWFAGPGTSGQFWAWTLLGFGAASLLVIRRRVLGSVLAVGLVATVVEAYGSYALDAVEVQRHMVGPFFRLTILVIVAVGLAVDSLALPRPERPRVPVSRSAATAIGGGVTLVAAAWAALEYRSQDYDPQYARTIVERAARYGGSYYENGVHNKGPFETFVYDVARWFTSWDSYWFGIALFVLVATTVIALAGAAIARIAGAGRWLATSVAAAGATHFAVSSSDYAGVLYSRNITTALLAAALLIVLLDRLWLDERRARIAWVGVGIMIGLAVQTLLTTVFVGAVVLGLAHALRSAQSGFERPLRASLVAAFTTIAGAPVWYLLRGSFEEFWSGWWTYAGFMSSGTGRSLLQQFGLGWQTFVGYHQDRPMALVVVIATLTVIVSGGAGRRVRLLGWTLVAWWSAGWIELVLGQRYSSHYFSVVAVPLFLMAALLAGRYVTMLVSSRRSTVGSSRNFVGLAPLAPLAVSLAIVAGQGTTLFWNGVEVSSRFESAEQYAAERESGRSGESRTQRAVLDLVSRDGDALLAWTMYPWTYLEHERVPATRFSWKSFMIGEIYLGRTSIDYVLPRTWTWFAEDLAESQPNAYVRTVNTPLDESTPFAATVRSDFTLVHSGQGTELSVANDLWNELLESPTAPRPEIPAGSTTELASADCVAVSGNVDPTELGTGLVIWLRDSDGSSEDVALGLTADRAWSASSSVEFASTSVDDAASFTLLVGTRSAVLVVDDRVAAAVRLDGTASVMVEGNPTRLFDLRTGRLSGASGCDSPELNS